MGHIFVCVLSDELRRSSIPDFLKFDVFVETLGTRSGPVIKPGDESPGRRKYKNLRHSWRGKLVASALKGGMVCEIPVSWG